jgi:GTP-binding protein Era
MYKGMIPESELPVGPKRSAFAVIVGRSNVGKSTLLNSLIGTKVSIVTEKPQTTRTRIQGMLTERRGQIVFVDTPGIFHLRGDELTRRLNDVVAESLHGIDIVLYVVDPTRAVGNEEHAIQRLLEGIPKEKKILVINKTDVADRQFEHEYERIADQFAAVIRVSALDEVGLDELKTQVFSMATEGPAMFPEGQFSTVAHTEWMAEIIREKAFKHLQDELPYSVMVRIDTYGEKKGVYHIHATLLTTNDRYKGIIIGKNALKIMEISTAARKELEVAMNIKVFLRVDVDVDPDWQLRFATPVGE